MTRHPVLFILVVALASCAKREADGGSRTDTTLVFVASPSQTGRALRIRITGDAKVYAGDDLVSLAVLDSLLVALKAAEGEVWYYREAGDRQPTGKQDTVITSVLNAIIRHRLPVRLSSKPDFSDVVDAHGQPSSQRP